MTPLALVGWLAALLFLGLAVWRSLKLRDVQEKALVAFDTSVALRMERDEARAELRAIDELLTGRPALYNIDGRTEKIAAALEAAGRVSDKLIDAERELKLAREALHVRCRDAAEVIEEWRKHWVGETPRLNGAQLMERTVAVLAELKRAQEE